MKKLVLALAMMSMAGIAYAKPVFTGKNYSGVYQCKGSNDQVGDYQVRMTLRQNKISSYGTFGAYHYEIETDNGTVYRGQVAADGDKLAMSFNLSEKKTMDHSTGIATIKKNSDGRWTFRRLYYEGDDSGGVYGSENCVLYAKLQEGVETPLKPPAPKNKK